MVTSKRRQRGRQGEDRQRWRGGLEDFHARVRCSPSPFFCRPFQLLQLEKMTRHKVPGKTEGNLSSRLENEMSDFTPSSARDCGTQRDTRGEDFSVWPFGVTNLMKIYCYDAPIAISSSFLVSLSLFPRPHDEKMPALAQSASLDACWTSHDHAGQTKRPLSTEKETAERDNGPQMSWRSEKMSFQIFPPSF